jgi:hypothetical protein
MAAAPRSLLKKNKGTPTNWRRTYETGYRTSRRTRL